MLHDGICWSKIINSGSNISLASETSSFIPHFESKVKPQLLFALFKKRSKVEVGIKKRLKALIKPHRSFSFSHFGVDNILASARASGLMGSHLEKDIKEFIRFCPVCRICSSHHFQLLMFKARQVLWSAPHRYCWLFSKRHQRSPSYSSHHFYFLTVL
jgi:hypothetical protein